MQHRHPGNWGTLFKSDWIDRVVRTNDERQIGIIEIVIDLVHFQHNYNVGLEHAKTAMKLESLTVIRNGGLGQENVALARHSSSDWMNCKPHFGSLGSEHRDDL